MQKPWVGILSVELSHCVSSALSTVVDRLSAAVDQSPVRDGEIELLSPCDWNNASKIRLKSSCDVLCLFCSRSRSECQAFWRDPVKTTCLRTMFPGCSEPVPGLWAPSEEEVISRESFYVSPSPWLESDSCHELFLFLDRCLYIFYLIESCS